MIREWFDWLRRKDLEAALEHPPIVCERSDPDECVILRPNFDMREQMMSECKHSEGIAEWCVVCLRERIAELEAELMAAELRAKTYEEGYDETLAARRYLETENERLRAALEKIKTEPGNARDCRRIAAEALQGDSDE